MQSRRTRHYLWSATCSSVTPTHHGPITESLFTAVGADDETAIKTAIKNGAEINWKDSGQGHTPLIGGQTPLMHAVLKGKETAARVLLGHSADIWIPNKYGHNPIHAAAFQGHPAIAQMLIHHHRHVKKKKDLNLLIRNPFRDGQEPIFRAAWGKEIAHTETVRVFLDAGVPPDVTGLSPTTGETITVLEAAEKEGNKKTIKLIKKRLKKWNRGKGGGGKGGKVGEKKEL